MIDPEAFAQGMNRLALLPVQGGVEADSLASRKILYFEALSPRISTDQWMQVVHEAFTDCRWFPTPVELLDIAKGLQPSLPMLPPGRNAEERERDREAARRGVHMVREAYEKATGLKAPPIHNVVKEMPHALPEDERNDRIEALKRQAVEIQEVKA